MTQQNTNAIIRAALGKMAAGDLIEVSTQLLAALGYRSDVTAPEMPGGTGEFVAVFPATNPNTRTERDFLNDAESVRLLFQMNDRHVAESAQRALFDAASFDTGNAQSFLFAAVQLRGDKYPRGQYAAFTRELNKRFPMPMVLLFRTAGNLITLAFVHRRPNKRDPERDVLGSVSLIREIDPVEPHRAHVDILAELSLPERLKWMDGHAKAHNFDGLLEAWLAGLDTEELNKRFYQDLFRWFQKAVVAAKFPDSATATVTPEEHVIRLITRLMFVWFIKEKGLVAGDLFIENQVSQLLKDYDRAGGDSYYRAVLQNLFFATLNTEIGERRFSLQNNDDHRNFSVYRYHNEMADHDSLLELFAATPFINGGLFDCLDSFDATGTGGVRVDCFTDNAKHRRGYSIPNHLFFDEDRDAPGLIALFDGYKFTVEENTPAEREVALDPELLGKVFENLLAAFNPETRENVRKQTGSYYTPRAVVDYMVDEALVATLAQKAAPADGDAVLWQERLRSLLDYDVADADTLFEPAEKTATVRAIAEIRVLDPAVGSGAFPMGILHKLTLALRRLDPRNELWEGLQKELSGRRAAAAFDTADSSARESELAEISRTFDQYRDSDFGRKLYLIQNGIYGVDIQPIATQIAKLRFFISLAIEQEPNDDDDNYGIRPLPNLETRFVAADTLLGLDKKDLQIPLGGHNRVMELNDQLRVNRERHFHAGFRRDKLRIRKEDERLRGALAAELQKAGISKSDAGKIAAWDPYEQNATAGWFGAEYMFGVANGFDVVIGNPPYVELQKNGGELRRRYQDSGYHTIASRGDVYQLFYEKGCQLLAPQRGTLAYITSNSWLKAEYGKSTRRYFTETHTPLSLLDMGKDVFDNSIVDACVVVLREGRSEDELLPIVAVDMDRLKGGNFPPEAEQWGFAYPEKDAPWSILSTTGHSVMGKMQTQGIPLSDWNVTINYGVKTGYNEAFIIDEVTKDALVAVDGKSADIIKPMLRGRDIQRYQAKWANLWLIIAKFGSYRTLPEKYPAVHEHLLQYEQQLRARGQCRYSRSRKSNANPDYDGQHHWLELDNNPKDDYLDNFGKEKLVWIELTEEGRFAYDDTGIYGEATTFIMTGEHIKFLCAVLNSRLIRWYLGQIAPTSGMGTLRWKKVYVETVPVPQISAARQRPFIRLVDRILAAKASNSSADTSDLEEEIDWLVYDLYGLTNEETAVIADFFWDGTLTEEEEEQALLRAMEEADTSDRVSLEGVLATLRAPNDG